jgi:hypothetical protein
VLVRVLLGGGETYEEDVGRGVEGKSEDCVLSYAGSSWEDIVILLKQMEKLGGMSTKR